MRSCVRILSLWGMLFVLAVAVLAQRDAGQITGTVTDQSGAPIANAKVTVKSVATGLTRAVSTNIAGNYVVPSLPADTYEVTVQATGFSNFVSRVGVTVGSNNELSPQMAVAAATTTVEVASNASTVNTETQTLSTTVSLQQLSDLPTSPTRNPYALVAISGNVAEDMNSGRGAGFAINGMRSASTSILLDGAENVSAFTADVGQTVPLDSVQEFSVLTNNFTAEYGRASGGVVNLITKSGTNSFHGSAYEYNRVSALSANTFENNATDTPKGIFTRNDFGVSAGGPIVKNKLFFFENAEWIRVRSASPTDLTIIDPNSYSMLAPASQTFFSTYGKLAPNLQTLNKVPCSSSGLTCDIVSFSVPADAGGGLPQNTWEEVAKFDYNLSNNTSIGFRYAGFNELDFPGTVVSSPYQGYNTGQTNFDQNISLTATHVFSPAVVDTAKAVYNRLNGPTQPLGSAPVGPTLYTSNSLPSVGGFPLVFPGYSETTPGNSIPFGGPQNLYQFYNDISWTKGKHQLKFGGQFIQIRDNRTFGAYENAVELLGTNLNSGLANLISGNIYQFEGAVYPQGKYPCPNNAQGVAQVSAACTLTLPVSEPSFERNYRYNDFAFYGQDSWKVARRFTANLGLRWEYYGVQHDANPALDSNFVMGSGPTIFDQIRNGSVQLAQNGGVFWKPDYHNFSPRVGFAYDVFGDGSTAIRGGFSTAYERNFGNVTFNAIQNPPNYAVVSLIAGQDVPSMPVFTNNAGPLAGTGTKALPHVSQRAINQNIATAYAESWDFGIERRVSRSAVVSAFYSGSHGVHLYDIANINTAGYGSTFLGDADAANRLNYQYSNMNFRSDNGFSHYEALNLKVAANNLWNKGLGIVMNYTWSHALDNLSSTFTETYGGNSGLYQLGYLDAFNPRLNFGNADFDIRHRFVLSDTWEMPWLKDSSNKFLRSVVGGWGFGSILNIRTGAPFTIYDCTNFNGTACPLYVAPTQVPTTGTAVAANGNDFAPNTFNYITLPNSGGSVLNQGDSLGIPVCKGLDHQGCTYTSSGLPYPERNQFFGPGFWNLDANIFKNFRLTERFTVQFRAELYNIFNHNNQYIQGLNLDVSSLVDSSGNPAPYIQTEKGGVNGYAGQPTDERRNVQFALRLMF
jgi:Carboxypeptidase regulatory-like domain/TonB dependent receptor/TonB-dependent Receptor Plug Domain